MHYLAFSLDTKKHIDIYYSEKMNDNAYQTNILLLHKVELKEHHNIAEIVLKLALYTKQSINQN
jgi:hypothetical protein